MREIKFRYFHEGKMRAVKEIKFEYGKPSSIDLSNGYSIHFMNGDGYKDIMPSIGSLDLKNKEIYLYSNEDGVFIGQVVWEESDELHLGKWAIKKIKDVSDDYEDRDVDYFEVIGNIIENPELLEEETK